MDISGKETVEVYREARTGFLRGSRHYCGGVVLGYIDIAR